MFTIPAIRIHLTTIILMMLVGLFCYYTYPIMMFPVKLLLTIVAYICVISCTIGAVASLIAAIAAPGIGAVIYKIMFNPETGDPYWWDNIVNAPITGSVFFAFLIGWLFWMYKINNYKLALMTGYYRELISSKPVLKYKDHIAALIAIPVTYMLYSAVSPEQILNITAWATLATFCYLFTFIWPFDCPDQMQGSSIGFYHMAAITAYLLNNHNNLAEAAKTLSKIGTN